jgi:hypothetical protein
MIVKGANFMDNTLFLFVGRSSRAFPYSRKLEISSNSLGAASTRNKCASRRSSSMHVGSSPVSGCDR